MRQLCVLLLLILSTATATFGFATQEAAPRSQEALQRPTPARLIYGGDHNFPPWEYLDDNGQPQGFSVELVRAIAKETGIEIEIRLDVWDATRAKLDTGRIDFLSLTYSDARAQKYDYLGQTWTLQQVVAFCTGRSSYPARLDQLANETVAVQARTLLNEQLQELPEVQRPLFRFTSDQIEAVSLLAKGDVTAAVGNTLTLRLAAARIGIDDLVFMPVKLHSYHFATQKGRKQDLAALDGALELIRKNGKLNQLVESYLVMPPRGFTWKDYAWYIWAALALIGLLVIGAVSWTRLLRQQVRARTRELEESEERYRELFENANDIIYVADLDWNIISLNRAGERIFGYTKEQALKMNMKEIIAPEYMEIARQMFERKLAGERQTTYEIEVVNPNGKRFKLETSTRLIYKDGKAARIQGIARDITEHKRLEEELRHSQKMEAVGRLAGGVAHDFNNLLTVITGYSELLLQGDASGERARYQLEEIRKAAERATSLTRQLLAFSRKQVLAPRILDLNTVMADTEKMLRRVIGEDIELITSPFPVLGRVKADPGQLEQVLLNLAVNARDAMPHGGRLTLQTANVNLNGPLIEQHTVVAPGQYVTLVVSDTGSGMDAEIQSHIFEPFFTTKEQGKGTGLGLSTVYGIVKQSGGEISVQSEPGRGTTFTLYFPRVEEDSESSSAGLAASPRSRGSEIVLVVEDEEGVRQLVCDILRRKGYTVLEAGSGDEALSICERHRKRIQMMVTDVVMPRMNGPQLAERAVRLCPNMKVLYMSGYADHAITDRGDEKTPFLAKPFSSEALALKVREVLDFGYPSPPPSRAT